MRTQEDIEYEMEIIAYLYGYMDDETRYNWSLEAAADMVAEQHTFEIENGITPREHSVIEFYEVVSEFIEQGV